MKKKGIVFTGGSGPEKHFVENYIKPGDTIVAADSGMDLADSFGIVPDYLVGDMDSITDKTLIEKMPKDRIILSNSEKDETDTELGIELLISKGCQDIMIIGGGGGRIDHFIGIFFLFYREVYPRLWFMKNFMIHCIDRKMKIYGKIGSEVSFFPAGTEMTTMASSGLKWNLNALTWKIGDAGISNVILESPCMVSPKTGRLLMVSKLNEELYVE